MKALEFETTEDGSISLRDNETGELFHNRAGAYTEALHNYVQPSGALSVLTRTGKLRVLDVCFGLGYNSMVLLQQVLGASLLSDIAGEISITGIEIESPILAIWCRILDDERFSELRQYRLNTNADALQTSWRFDRGNLGVSLNLLAADFRTVICELAPSFDFVFHDPFSPRRVPQLWTLEIFQQYRRLLEPGGSVLTYSAAVAVRSGLRIAGFNIGRTSAVGGKSGGTIATLDENLIATAGNGGIFELSRDEEARLHTSSAVPYRDPAMQGDCASVLSRRQQEQLDLKFAK